MNDNTFQQWIKGLTETTPQQDVSGLLLVTGLIFGSIIIVILMYFGLKKCVRFGNKIGHSVFSFNIILFGIPVFMFLFLKSFFHINIPDMVLIITTVLCWGIALVYNVIILRSSIIFMIRYTYLQFLFGILLASVVGAIIASVLFFCVIGLAVGSEKSSYYDITLVPIGEDMFSSSSHMIRARYDENRSGFLIGENGEVFEHISGNQYMLLSSSNSDSAFNIYVTT